MNIYLVIKQQEMGRFMFTRSKLSLSGMISIVVLSLTAAQLSAALVAVGDYNGSRTTVGTDSPAGGLVWNPEAGLWSAGNFKIAWNITDNGSDFTYQYTITSPADAALSHWILQLSQFDVDGNDLTSHWDSLFTGEVKTYTAGSSGNPGLPASIYGVKFDGGGVTFTFTTTHAPVWGDFYAKDGGGNSAAGAVYAYNVGIGQDPAGPFLNWIARPDGEELGQAEPIPEPATLLVWSLGGLALAFGRRLTRSKNRAV